MPSQNELLLDPATWRGKIHVDGWVNGGGADITATDKATGKALGTLGGASPGDVENAAGIARKAQQAWVGLPLEERAAVFRRAVGLLERHHEELAEWIMRETGGIRPKAEMELKRTAGILHESAAMLLDYPGVVLPTDPGRISYARRMPHGVVGVIAPFNVPLVLAIRAVAPALATGNAVLLKPDPQTAVAGGVLIARLFEEAGLPSGLLHLLPGGADVGEALCTDPNIAMIAFTGSTATGRRIGELAGRHLKKVSLELGGNNALIVLDDADLDLAASNAAFGAWNHQGQICMTTGRILAHAGIADALVERLVEKAGKLPVGDPMSGKVALGPLINARQLAHVDGLVRDSVAAGARLAAGGGYEHLFFQPTVLDGVSPGVRAFDEEIFGPVASVTRFETDDEAVALANRGDYGLSAGIISRNVARALDLGGRLNVGLLQVNDQTIVSGPQIPFGGRGASGNGGRIGGPANWEEFTQWQWVTIRGTPPAYPF
ncbi:MAG: benzaldehyde dehydrogenase [Aquisalimonadaceae bacterium]